MTTLSTSHPFRKVLIIGEDSNGSSSISTPRGEEKGRPQEFRRERKTPYLFFLAKRILKKSDLKISSEVFAT